MHLILLLGGFTSHPILYEFLSAYGRNKKIGREVLPPEIDYSGKPK